MSIVNCNEIHLINGRNKTVFAKRPLAHWVRRIALASVASSTLLSGAAIAQQAAQTEQEFADTLEEVVVTGTRRVIQDQIAIKREATAIVDGLSASDIGDLPALSIGEALESIAGAASHRENGGATEISIRGLGPFLSSTTFNGREATNGSGDRSVNFSQFPSELMSKLQIYKTQDASLIEGGVAGVIALETLKPLDYDKQRIQVDAKLNFNPDEDSIENSLQDGPGFRGTASYVDQFELDGGAALGLSIGVQSSSSSQPEAEVRSSSPTGSSLWACLNDPGVTNEGFYRDSSGDCEDQNDGGSRNQGYDNEIDPATGLANSDGIPYAFTGSSRGYRQNETSEERDAAFFAIQFQPNDTWDINIDAQYSDRIQAEDRHDLVFEQKRVTPGVTGPALVVSDSGAISEWAGTVRVEANGEKYSRQEKYKGGGFNVSHDLNDRLTIDLDASYSQTTREELQISVRARGDRIPVTWKRGSDIPHYTLEDYDVTDHQNFDSNFRARVDHENVRENTIKALRLDFDYELESDLISSVKGGFRSSSLNFIQFGGTNGNGSRTTYGGSVSGDTLVDGVSIIDTCAISFPETDFLESVSDGDLITNVDSSGTAISQGTGSSYAAFRNQCIADVLSSLDGEAFAYPDVEEINSGTRDVTEDTLAVYMMADYASSFMGRDIRGNFGVRIVDTEIESVGYRTPYQVVDSSDGGLLLEEVDDAIEKIHGKASYTEVLPSINFVWDYDDEVIIRGGLFRGMSRADPSDLGYSRTFQSDETGTATSLSDLVTAANGSGNPNTKPLTSWNADVSFEYYPSDDSILSAGFYFKKFTGGFEQRTVIEDFVIDGQTLQLPITNTVTTKDESNLFGIELTASHRWENGVGFKASYNYSDSDFEFEDSNYGETYTTDVDGVTTQLTTGIVAPGNIPGFSKHVFSGQLYYQIGNFDVAAIYKYRSDYFQPYTSNGTRLRFVDDVGVWEARASYKVTDNITVKLEAINLFSEPKKQFFYVRDNLGEVNDYGPRVFVGMTAKF